MTTATINASDFFIKALELDAFRIQLNLLYILEFSNCDFVQHFINQFINTANTPI